MRKTTRSRLTAIAAAIALGSGLATVPATAALAAYTCNLTNRSGYWYAGYYTGVTVEPSTSSVSNAGIEAQCLLRKYGYNPGTIDGIFGSNSRAAARNFQEDMNDNFGAGLREDGIIGRNSWPHLRSMP
jgi:peptidoglycan hydrolase-like protein with peptidoglycan-binding domain